MWGVRENNKLKTREESIVWRLQLQNETGLVCLPRESGMERISHVLLKDPRKRVLWPDEQSGG